MTERCCISGKKKYETRRHAKSDADVITRKGLSAWYRHRHMDVFWCRECQSWHVGSLPKKKILLNAERALIVQRQRRLRYETRIAG